MKLRALLILALIVAQPASVLLAQELPGHMVVNGDLTAVLKTADGAQRQLSGRMNGYFILSGESLAKGARIEALNLALFGVDQQAMTGKATRGKPTGVVGFSATTDGDRRQSLRYDAASRSLVGQVRGHVDMPQLYELAPLQINPEDDLVQIPTLEATVEVRIGLGVSERVQEGQPET